MSNDNDNIARNGWTEYGKLVLNELKRLNEGQEKLRTEIEERFKEVNHTLGEFKSTEEDVESLKHWKDKVNEVWSTTQMKESKDEIYNQKNKWLIVVGVGIAIQVIWAIFILFKDRVI